MHDSKTVADYFIEKAEEEDSTVTPMKLLKLVYFAHGYNLALEDEALIREPVEAWEYGPVIPDLYHSVKGYGDNPVREKLSETNVFGIQKETVSDNRTQEILDAVWDAYSKYDAVVLSDMTHMPGTPWYDLYQEYGGDLPRHKDISDQRIKEHFEEKLDGDAPQ